MNTVFQYAVTGTALVIACCMDVRYRKISRNLIGVYLLTVIIGHVAAVCLTGSGDERKQQIIACAAEIVTGMLPGVCCLFLSFVTQQALGYGDSLLIFVCGMSLGLNACISVLMSALFLSGIWALIRIVMKRAERCTEIPFVPFLLMGLAVYMINIV